MIDLERQWRAWTGRLARHGRMPLRLALLILGLALSAASPALAIDPIVVGGNDRDVVDVTDRGVFYENRGDRLQVPTAAGADGIEGRMAVRAAKPGGNPRWVLFALSNPGSETVERWLTVDRYLLNGSRFFSPDLDKPRLAAITPSIGFQPERIASDKTDIFRLSLEPGAVVTFVAELSGETYPRLNLWRVEAFEKQRRNSHLFNGILLGVTGIIAILLTALFAANHKLMFPAGALVIWTGLAYLCVEFGFWHKLFNLSVAENATYRAASEAAFAAALVVFLYVFLSLRLWHLWVQVFFGGWLLAQLTFVLLAFVDAPLASSLARLSFGGIALIGSGFIAYLALRGQSRALSLMPAWLLFLVWLFGAGVTIEGHLAGDMVISAMNAGLVLLMALFGFTVTQFAFHGLDHTGRGPADRYYTNGQAIEGAGAGVWFWDARRDHIVIGHEIEESLGLSWHTLAGTLDNWLEYLHPTDRERFGLMLSSVKERMGGPVDIEFRMRRSDGTYLWYSLKAHTDDWIKARTLNCVGLLQDITSSKRAQDRLMHDAVHDSLTGLPNRELFFDRLSVAVTNALHENLPPPAVLFIDLDRFRNINTRFGMGAGDTMLLTVSRRIQRHLRPQDALARIGGDQFAVMLPADRVSTQLVALADRIRKSVREQATIAGEEVMLTCSIGVALLGVDKKSPDELFREAEIAMFGAKRLGTDRIEQFKPEMLDERDDRVALESDLRQAIERHQLDVLYQPIMRLSRNELVGFEALLRWEHPRLGTINPAEFVPIAEENGTIAELGAYVLDQAVKEAARWQRLVPMNDKPLFVSVNVSSGQLFREGLVSDIRHVVARQNLPRGALRLEITETLVMENPEQAIEILNRLKALGAGLSMDDFGTGYSSLAYLLRFPFDTIKVDREIVQHRDQADAGGVILRSIVALAHELDKDVVAEGIETEEDAAYLRSIRCDYAQGFYFGEAMHSSEVHNLLKALVKAGRLTVKPLAKASKQDDQPESVATTTIVAAPGASPQYAQPGAPPSPQPSPPPTAQPGAARNAAAAVATPAPPQPQPQPAPAAQAGYGSIPGQATAAQPPSPPHASPPHATPPHASMAASATGANLLRVGNPVGQTPPQPANTNNKAGAPPVKQG